MWLQEEEETWESSGGRKRSPKQERQGFGLHRKTLWSAARRRGELLPAQLTGSQLHQESPKKEGDVFF